MPQLFLAITLLLLNTVLTKRSESAFEVSSSNLKHSDEVDEDDPGGRRGATTRLPPQGLLNHWRKEVQR